MNAYLTIKSGEGEIIVAGGQESMSQSPHAIYLRNSLKMGDGTMIDTMIFDGLTDAFASVHMGITGLLSFVFTFFFLIHIQSSILKYLID